VREIYTVARGYVNAKRFYLPSLKNQLCRLCRRSMLRAKVAEFSRNFSQQDASYFL